MSASATDHAPGTVAPARLRRPSTGAFAAILSGFGAILIGAPVRATTFQYALEIHDGQEGAFEVQFPVENPGKLQILAEWTGGRVISLRVEEPGEAANRWRRSGPSPQRVSVEVAPEACAPGRGDWKLSIRALASRGEARGTITIEAPDPPHVVREREAANAPKPPPPPEPEPWEIARVAPADASPELSSLFREVEGLRSTLLSGRKSARADVCGWQVDLLRALTVFRDRLGSGEPSPSDATLRYVERLAATVARIEALRTSTDPILAGPVPEESLRRRAWLAVRKERLQPLVEELDSLSESLRKGYVPDLSQSVWPSRFVACLTACERHFEERVRFGAEEATNRDLAEAQWERFLIAERALSSLARFVREPATETPRALAPASEDPPGAP